MPDYSATRSEYLKVMMGNRKDALAPYRPEQMGEVGDTSFDAASLSDDDINAAIAQMTGTQRENSDIFKSLKTEQASRKEKAEQENKGKDFFETVGDFFSNIGTSITEGVLNVVDDVWDFSIGLVGGIGGGWYGQKNDFTDWVADAMTDDRWVSYATKGLTLLDVFDKGFWTNDGGYWNDWSYDNVKAQEERDYHGMDWLRKGGNFVGEIIPSLVLAYFTGGASLGVQAAVQGGLGLARGMGNAQSRALSEGATFQEAAGYGAVKGAISGALSAGLTYVGGTFASRGVDSIVSKAGNSIGDAVLAKTGSASLSAFANSASKFIIRVAGDAGEAAVLTAIEPAFQQIYNDNAWYNAYGTDENRKSYAEQIGRAALTAAAFSAVTNAVRDVWQVHKAGGRKAYMEQYEQGAYQRLSKNEILKSLSRTDRKMAQEGEGEWRKIQSEIDRVQSEYEAMKAKGASDADLELFIGKNKEAISKHVSSFSDKYGKLFTKLSAKAHPDVLPSTDNAKLAEARRATFQRYSSMTNKGAKEQLSQLFNGKNGIAGLITYTSGSTPVETVKENDSLVARPKNFEQVQSVLAAAAEGESSAPAVLELPLKSGNNVRLDISIIAPKQLESIALLNDSDFKTLPDGNRVADLGDQKSFVISKDGTKVMVLNSSEIDDFDHITKAITLPDGRKASLVEYVDGLVKSDRSLEFSVEENENGKYLKYSGQGLNGFSQEDKVRILKMYLTKKYQNTEIALDGDSISVTRQSIKKLGKFSGHNLDKAYLELKELGEIAKFDKRVANKKNKELNAPSYSYYVAKMEIDGSIVHFQFNVRESPDRSPMLYAIQEIKNGGVVPGNNSSLAPSTVPVSGGSNSGFALAPATNNIPKAKKDVKPENELPTKDNNGAERDYRELREERLRELDEENRRELEIKLFGKGKLDEADFKPSAQHSAENDAKAEPLATNAEPSIVKEAANAKVGKVYSLSKAQDVVNAIDEAIQDVLAWDNLGGKTVLNYKKGELAKALYDTINLGTPEQKAALLSNLREKLLGTTVKYKLDDFYGKTLDSYEGTLKEFLSALDEDERTGLIAEIDKLFKDLENSGSDSAMKKVIDAFSEKLSDLADKYQSLKVSTKLTGHIEKHRVKLVERYYHGDVDDFAPGFDFDNQGFRVLIQPLHDFKITDGKQSYTGSSVRDALKTFLDGYKEEYFKKGESADGTSMVSALYNQGLRDLANALLDSIEANNVHVLSKGQVRVDSLNAEQLSMLRVFQDTIEKMPAQFTKDRLEAVSNAQAAYHGVERYLSSVLKGDEIGAIRKAVQWSAERYSNQLDALNYEIGYNILSKAVTEELYLSQAQASGMKDDFQGEINDLKKTNGVTPSNLDAKSAKFKDVSGKPIELRYLETVYRHLLSGKDSNNVKYIEANTVYIYNKKDDLAHVAKFSYSDLAEIESELKEAGLLEYSKGLHEIDSVEVGDVYDEDYLRDTHMQNSNRLKDHTHIELETNASKLGKATVKSGVARYGQQKDRVDKVPTGVHLVIRDGESAIMAQVANQANIHFNDPVLRKINAILGTKLDASGRTVKEYLRTHNPGALTLIERAIYGAYGINPNKSHRLIDFVGNGYVMTLIGMNPSSVMKQPISIMWSNDISMASVLKFTIGANLNPTIWKNSTRLIKEIEEEFPALKLRGKKNEALLGNTASEVVGKVQSAIAKVAGFGLRVSDAWTVGHEAVGLLAMQGQALGYGEIGTPENDEYVKYHYRAFYATQVSSDRITMSGARAGYYGSMGKFTSFMTGAVQGQIGYLIRGLQQYSEYKGKTQKFYDDLIAKTKSEEDSAKKAYEEAQENLKATQKAKKEGNATNEDLKNAKKKFKTSFEKYAEASGKRADAENSAKGFKHYADMGGAKGAVLNRLGAVLVSAIALTLIGELNAKLKGQKEWDEFNVASLGSDFAVNAVGWAPIVRDLVNAAKGYNMDIPEYAMVKQAYELFSAAANVVKNPSDKTSRALLRQAVEVFASFTGVPVANVWKYVYGITKTFSPEAALKMRDVLYGASPRNMASTAKEYASKNDISTAADLYLSLYTSSKTGKVEREVIVEEAKLVRDGFNPIARSVPEYYQNDKGERIDLTEKQRSTFFAEYAKSNAVVAKLIKSSQYQSAGSEIKAKLIKKVYDVFYEVAKYKSLGIEPSSKLGRFLAYCGGDFDIAQTLLLIQQNAELVDSKRFSKKEQALRLVNRQSMSRNQKLLTLYLMGYGISEQNKKALQNYLASLGFGRENAKEFIS